MRELTAKDVLLYVQIRGDGWTKDYRWERYYCRVVVDDKGEITVVLEIWDDKKRLLVDWNWDTVFEFSEPQDLICSVWDQLVQERKDKARERLEAKRKEVMDIILGEDR